MIDHITLRVTDIGRSIDFYTRVLAPLGYVPKVQHDETIGFGVSDGTPHADFYVSPLLPSQKPAIEDGLHEVLSPITHIAFQARDDSSVRLFYQAGIAAGGKDYGQPGLRDYHPGYFAAFILDPDGNNIEAVVDWAHGESSQNRTQQQY